MTNAQLYNWFAGLEPSVRVSYIRKYFPKWNPDNWSQLMAYQIKAILRGTLE